jgi:type IV pilus assembly protein PilB
MSGQPNVATPQQGNKNVPIGKLLLMNGLITVDQLEYALKIQKSKGKKLGDILIELGYVKERDLMKILSARLKVDYVEISKINVRQEAVDLMEKEYAEKYNIFPIDCNDKIIVIATTDPMNYFLLDDVKIKTGKTARPVLSTADEIEKAIAQFFTDKKSSEATDNINQQFEMEELANTLDDQIKNEVDNAPIVKFVNTLIATAVNSGTSDIHIEPQKEITRVRMRIDGQLVEKMQIKAAAHNSLITRIKIMSGMDIAEKRIPQDGRIETKIDDKSVDLRVSSLPTVYGEKIVIRVLGGIGSVLSINQLGLSETNEEFFRSIIKSPNGIILICGPTGSGKTTTLYSVLAEVNDSRVNTITIEDPVEYKLDGITQVQVNAKAGLTFAAGLRSVLRQDPDIVMIGEIRDNETAQIAVKAAITGHVVLSTIHTNSACGAVARLVDMEIEPYLVASSAVGIVAQRLVKKLCPYCKHKYTTDQSEMDFLGLSEPMEFYKAVGCKECGNTGYKGRLAIHEILVVNSKIREMINKGAAEDELEKVAVEEFGMITLRECCLGHVKKGTVSVEELIRATYSV